MSGPTATSPIRAFAPARVAGSRLAGRLVRPLLMLLAGVSAFFVPVEAQEPVVAYQIVNARSIPASLTGRAGDAAAGRALYFDASLTGCSGCHGSPDGPGAVPSSGETNAPRLGKLAVRMSEGEIRLWLVAPQVLAPGTAMPAFYALGQRDDPKDPRYGEPWLRASEIEDLVAYLLKAGR